MSGDLPEILDGRDLEATDPADLMPRISRDDGTALLGALGARISDGEAAHRERATLIATLAGQGWTQAEIAAAAGLSQQAVSKSLRTSPGERALAALVSEPYLCGRLIGVALHFARTRKTTSERAAEKLYERGVPVTDITVARLRQLLSADLRGSVPGTYAAALEDITGRLDASGGLPPLPWSAAQHAEMVLGQHHQSHALTQAISRC